MPFRGVLVILQLVIVCLVKTLLWGFLRGFLRSYFRENSAAPVKLTRFAPDLLRRLCAPVLTTAMAAVWRKARRCGREAPEAAQGLPRPPRLVQVIRFARGWRRFTEVLFGGALPPQLCSHVRQVACPCKVPLVLPAPTFVS